VKIAGAWVGEVDVTDTNRMEFHPSGSIAPYSIKLVLDGAETELKGDIFRTGGHKRNPRQAKDQ